VANVPNIFEMLLVVSVRSVVGDGRAVDAAGAACGTAPDNVASVDVHVDGVRLVGLESAV